MRKIDILSDYEPRFDPTVIPIRDGGHVPTDTEKTIETIQGAENRNCSIDDYVAAYRSKTITPRKVVEVLLSLVDKDASDRHEFVSIDEEEVFAAAEASTKRYREGKAIGPLDGVPVAIKGRRI